MITLTSLSKIYRTDEIETVALENVNLTVDRGEFLSIMGPSGCGKSTLLNIMGLLDAPTTGTVEINGTHTEGMKDKQLAALIIILYMIIREINFSRSVMAIFYVLNVFINRCIVFY